MSSLREQYVIVTRENSGVVWYFCRDENDPTVSMEWMNTLTDEARSFYSRAAADDVLRRIRTRGDLVAQPYIMKVRI